jgi:hypothetical protein
MCKLTESLDLYLQQRLLKQIQTKSNGIKTKKTPRPESARKLYRPSDRRLSAKLIPISADRGCHVVSVTDPYDRILDFLYRSRYFFFQVALQLYSRGWAHSVSCRIQRRPFRYNPESSCFHTCHYENLKLYIKTYEFP